LVISYHINYFSAVANDSGTSGIAKHWLSFVAYINDIILEAARACNTL
jgi:hypothetical protein